jgi:ABC-type transport system involved in cytochrome c biogenesis permease component
MRSFGRNVSVSGVWPVIVRELRAESRRSTSFWLRLLAAVVVIGVFAGFVSGTELGASQLGAALFAVLHQALLLATWIIVPMMTADCISREKREGTLGLLFLTPLTVPDVIAAKAATQILRAITLLLASMPVLVLPFVLGGVQWQEALVAIATLANALLLGIAAGLYASAKGGTATQVMVVAVGYALALAVVSAISQLICGFIAGNSLPGLAWRLTTTLGFTFAIFPKIIEATVRVLRQTWDQDSATPEQPKWVRAFSGSEFWQTVFHWERGRALDRNPIAWLQEYSWTARLTKWGWCLGALIAEFFMLLGFPGWQPQLITALALGVAFSATGSFRRERQSGALETLLVTPLSVERIIAGRLWGMFSHFVPALAVLMVCWNADRVLDPRDFEDNPLAMVIPNPVMFGALMIVGLYLSLWRLNFLMAWVLAWALVFLIPASGAVWLGQSGMMQPGAIIAVTTMFQLALAVACWFLVHRVLEQRKFLNAGAL